MKKAKLIAFYLPQFHQTPENDRWWGVGFTEWRNTEKAKPLYQNHYQPRKPFNNNYYDLANASAIKWQIEVARSFGIDGFCFYHYWFKGKRLLYKPLDTFLRTREDMDLSFCLSWANEPWTRAWSGGRRQILMPQDYGNQEDWREHFNFLNTVFKDSRYIKINNKPMFIIYRPSAIPNCDKMLTYWDAQSRRHGFNGIHYVEMLTLFDNKSVSDQFVAQIEFEPMYTIAHHFGFSAKLWRNLKKATRKTLRVFKMPIHPVLLNRIDYDMVWSRIIERAEHKKKITYLGAFPGWDNTARRGVDALIIEGASPEKFGSYIKLQIEKANKSPLSDFLFINAWNEWAEGAYIEPDQKYGYQYLEALHQARSNKVKEL